MWRLWRGDTLDKIAAVVTGRREGLCLDRQTETGWDLGALKEGLSSVTTVARSQQLCAAK